MHQANLFLSLYSIFYRHKAYLYELISPILEAENNKLQQAI